MSRLLTNEAQAPRHNRSRWHALRLRPIMVLFIALGVLGGAVSSGEAKRVQGLKRLSQSALDRLGKKIVFDKAPSEAMPRTRTGIRLPSGLIVILDQATLYAVKKSGQSFHIEHKRALPWVFRDTPKGPEAGARVKATSMHVTKTSSGWLFEVRIDGYEAPVDEHLHYRHVTLLRLERMANSLQFVPLYTHAWKRMNRLTLCAIKGDTYCDDRLVYGHCVTEVKNRFTLPQQGKVEIHEQKRTFIKRNRKFKFKRVRRMGPKEPLNRKQWLRKLRERCELQPLRQKLLRVQLNMPADAVRP